MDSAEALVFLGLLLWNQTRQQWVGIKGSVKREQARESKLRGCCEELTTFSVSAHMVFSWNTTYESLLGTNKPFRQPVPLAEMVDFLVDVWEQEGLYD
ncbi:hypothetical protein OROGR_006009 [Orobanche gracilis]